MRLLDHISRKSVLCKDPLCLVRVDTGRGLRSTTLEGGGGREREGEGGKEGRERPLYLL